MPNLSLPTGRHRALALVIGLAVLGGSALGIVNWLRASRARSAWERAALERAVRLEPDNALYHYRLGQWEQFSLTDGDLPRALEQYRRAVELNPHESRYWLDLADALLLNGNGTQAEFALQKALEVDPRTPSTLWRAGNFWLRAGHAPRAFAYFRQVVLVEPGMATVVIEACYRAAGDPEVILKEVLPAQPPFLLTYLRYLIHHQEDAAAARVWKALTRLGQPFDREQALYYVDHLIRRRRVPEALAAWNELQRLHLLPAASATPEEKDGELLYNASLRAPIVGGGFDWRVEPLPQVVVTLEENPRGAPAPAAVIRFTGETNLHYRHFFQFVPVEPRRRYRFQARLSTDAITTETGPQLEIADAYDSGGGVARSPALVGTNDWTQVQAEFLAGPETRLLRVGIVRLPSSRLENRIRGTVKATEFSLRPLGPASAGGKQ